jgi:hypothetical protein
MENADGHRATFVAKILLTLSNPGHDSTTSALSTAGAYRATRGTKFTAIFLYHRKISTLFTRLAIV